MTAQLGGCSVSSWRQAPCATRGHRSQRFVSRALKPHQTLAKIAFSATVPGPVDLEDRSHAASRRAILLASLAGCTVFWASPQRAQAAAPSGLSPSFLAAFQEALDAQGDFSARDAAWTRAIRLAPGNSAAWSNRGTQRLQAGRWAAAEADLAYAAALEAGVTVPAVYAPEDSAPPSALLSTVADLDPAALARVDALTLNNLGNAEVAVGKLTLAQTHFQAAAQGDPGIRDIALVNLALAAFEGRDDALAIRVARQVLRRDPAFLDARASLVAFLYASGQLAAAEGQWDDLQEAEDGLGGTLYNRRVAVARVRNRWPPRATAALTAFLAMAPTGTALGYDLQPKTFSFGSED